MRSALIHGVLLAVMLIYGYRTWTRDKTPKRDLGSVELWTKSESDLVSIEYKSDKKNLKLERRNGPAGAYWWATEVGIEKRPKKKPEEPKKPEPPKPADGSGSAGSAGSAASTGSAGSAAGSGSNVVAAGSGSAPAPAAGSGSGSAVVAAAGSGSAGSAAAPKPPAPPPAAGSGSGSATVVAAGSGSGSAPAPTAGSGSAGSGSATVAAGSGSAGSGSGSAAKPAAGSGSAVAAGSGSGSAKPPTPPPPTEFEEVKKPPREYPLGPEGDKLVEAYVTARAIRDLGPVDDKLKKDYKLEASKTTITITFKDGTRSFTVGTPEKNTTVRGMLDQSSNNLYAVSSQMFTGFETGENSIHLIDPRGIDDKELESITLEAISRSKSIARIETEVEKKKVKTWGDPATQKAEPALQNFVDGLANLKPTEYFPNLSPDTLTAVMKVTYRKGDSSVMGTLTLYKRDKAGATPAPTGSDDPANTKAEQEYFIVTQKTHVPALVKKETAEGIENNLPNVMSDNPTAPEPPKKPDIRAPGGPGGHGGPPGGLPPQLKPPRPPRTPPPGGAPPPTPPAGGGHDGHGH